LLLRILGAKKILGGSLSLDINGNDALAGSFGNLGDQLALAAADNYRIAVKTITVLDPVEETSVVIPARKPPPKPTKPHKTTSSRFFGRLAGRQAGIWGKFGLLSFLIAILSLLFTVISLEEA